MPSEGKNLVGVDIGSTSIKVAEIREGRGGQRELVRFGFQPLPRETFVDGRVRERGAIVEGLERLFHKSRRRDVAIRASGHSVIIKKVTMELMTPLELSEQIGWEAEQHIPFDLAEVEMDYEVLVRREEQRQMEVLLVAAKRDEIQELTSVVTDAKLKPRVVDLDAFTVQNCFEVGYGLPGLGQTVVLIHLGASLTTINIVADGTSAFTRDVAHGGHYVTEAIASQLGISPDEAETFKLGGDGIHAVPREVELIVEQVVDTLAGEIQRSLDFYLATGGGRDVERIVVSGGAANARGLRDAIQERSRLPVELFDPLRVARLNTTTVDPLVFAPQAPQAVVAMGLSLRKERERLT